SPSSSVLSGNPKSSNAVDRAKSWLAEVEPAIEGTGNGRGQNHTFFVCCTLIHGFRLTIDESLSILPAWNQTCKPKWNDNDLMRKLEDASKSRPDKPIGWMLTDGMLTLADLLSREF